MDFGNRHRSINELVKSDKYTILEKRDKKGRLIIEGDIDEFLKDLHCISLDEANKKFSELKMKNYHQINEAVKHGDFTEFNRLNEDEQIENMKSWTKDMRIKYLSQNSITDDDLFNEIYNIIERSDK